MAENPSTGALEAGYTGISFVICGLIANQK